MTEKLIVLTLSGLEAAHLTDLVEQFRELVADTNATDSGDPAVARLVPNAYRDDDDASAEFRRLTESDLLDRRRDEADTVLASLAINGRPVRPGDVDRVDAEEERTITLDPNATGAWLRTLAAIRLVLASRLDIRHEDDFDGDDPRFGIYAWLGARLEGLVSALDDDTPLRG